MRNNFSSKAHHIVKKPAWRLPAVKWEVSKSGTHDEDISLAGILSQSNRTTSPIKPLAFSQPAKCQPHGHGFFRKPFLGSLKYHHRMEKNRSRPSFPVDYAKCIQQLQVPDPLLLPAFPLWDL